MVEACFGGGLRGSVRAIALDCSREEQRQSGVTRRADDLDWGDARNCSPRDCRLLGENLERGYEQRELLGRLDGRYGALNRRGSNREAQDVDQHRVPDLADRQARPGPRTAMQRHAMPRLRQETHRRAWFCAPCVRHSSVRFDHQLACIVQNLLRRTLNNVVV